MKKFVILLVFVLSVLSAGAQVRLGGSVVIDAKTPEGADVAERNESLKLEGGYSLNEKWEVALGIGFTSRSNVNGTKDFGNKSEFFVNPYVRYTFAELGALGVFVDGAFQATVNTTKDEDSASDAWIGVRLGLKYRISDHFTLISNLGQWGFRSVTNSYTQIGLDLSNDLSLGLYYSF